jgi:hypothetical protein
VQANTNFSKKATTFLFSAFILLLLLNIINRIIVLQKFAFEYSDADQVMMWIGSYDFYKLEFYEPAYYGQNYNSMLEALLAAPFFRCASPAYILPIVTSVLALLPYLIIAIVCYRKQLKVQALFILAMPLILPPQYDFITAMPRGFVTGIFFAVLASIFLYHQEKKWSFFFFAFLSVTGFALNPNGILLTIPCGLFLLHENYKNKSFYIQSVFGGLLGAIYPFYMSYFYKHHPNYLVHELWGLRFSFANMRVGFSDLNSHFGAITPLYWYHSIILILLLIVIPIIFRIQKQGIWAIISLVTILFTIMTLGINKVYDGDGSVFLPVSRMYLAIPFVIILWVSFMKIKKWKLPVILILGIACCSFIHRTVTIDDAVDEALIPSGYPLLTTYKVSTLTESCNRIYQLDKKFDVDLILVASHWQDKYISYGCTTCNTDMPLTLTPSNDRRTWRLLQEKDKVYKTILLIDETQKIKQEALAPGQKPIELLSLGNNMFLLQNNSLTTLQLINRLKIELRHI